MAEARREYWILYTFYCIGRVYTQTHYILYNYDYVFPECLYSVAGVKVISEISGNI